MRRFSYSLSTDAQRDLAKLYLYLADQGDASIGRKLVDSLLAKIASLASSGHVGVAREWLSPGLRAFPYENRCVYFRVVDRNMRVLRILHGRQDVESSMFTDADAN